MKYYIKQKVFSWGDKFNIYTQGQEIAYTVKGEALSFGKKLHVYDPSGNEAAFIHQKVMSFLPRYFVSIDGEDRVCVVKEFSFLKPKYTIEGTDWSVTGKVTGHDYTIESGAGTVAVIKKQWFTWGDTYEIDIADWENELTVLCTVLIIDAVMAAQQAAAQN